MFAPLGLIFLLLLIGMALCYTTSTRVWRMGRQFIMAAFVLFVTFGILPTGHNLLVALERRAPVAANLLGPVDGILVLGGGIDTEVSASRGYVALNGAGERLWGMVAMAREFPQARIVYTGGNNALFQDGLIAETVYAELLLRDAGVPTANVLFEDGSRNTTENIANAKYLARPRPDQTWMVVTSAWHLPRTIDILYGEHWPGQLIYWPVDYRTDGMWHFTPRHFNILENMAKSSLGLHEWVGWITYRIRQKMGHFENGQEM